MRAALSIAVLVALDGVLDWPPMLEAALAALLTCLCDTGGPILRRVPPLLCFAVLGAGLTAGFGLLRGLGFAVIPFASAGIFCLGFLRVYGLAAQQVGNLASVALVLALDRHLENLHEALQMAAVFAGGSLWALVLTMVLWRVRPFGPVRRALGACYRALAELTADLRRLAAVSAEPPEWEAHARAYRRNVRNTIEVARGVVLDVLRGRGGSAPRATVYLIRLEIADQIFGAMLALSDVLEPSQDPELRRGADRFLRLLRPTLVVLGQVIEHETPERLVRLSQSLDVIAAQPVRSPALVPIVEAVVDRLRAFISLEAQTNPSLLPDDLSGVPSLLPGLWARLSGPVVANLDRNSAALRHAARAGVVSAFGFAVTIAWPGPYQHWLTIVLVMTMQPYYALTLQRALERVGGTVLGGALAAGLAMVCRTPGSMVFALFPLAVACLALRPASFGAFITLLTPLVVLLSDLGRPGTSQIEIATMRALYTVIGGALAVGGSLLLWPSWEPDRLARELRTAIAAHGRYASTELSLLLGEASVEAVDAARRGAGIASNNLEASLARALQEPRGQGGTLLEGAAVVDAALRRMAGRLSAMQLRDAHDDGRAPHCHDIWRAWRSWIAQTMAGLADPVPVLPSKRPASGADESYTDSLDRIGRQIEVIAGVVGRLTKLRASEKF